MMLFTPEGIIPALVTPFEKDNEVHEEALRNLVNFVVEKGVNGVVPVGTTGEFVYLSEEERRKVVEIVIDEVSGRVSVIAGTGASSTRQAIKLSKHAEDVGANAVLVVSPYYLRPADKGSYQHFYEISRATDIPIILYNIPQCTGDFLRREVVEDLAELDNVVGLKDSSGHLPYLMELLEMVGNKINIICGHDEVVMPALAAGAKGAILASANVIPDLWIRLHEAIRKGDLEKARKLQMDAQKLARIFCRHGGALAVKAALKMVGLNVGKARRPLVSGGALSWEIREEIKMELEKLGKAKPQPTKSELAPQKTLEERFQDLGIASENIEQQKLLIGEGLAGEGTEASRINLVAGLKDGPVGYALTRALANPRPGHEALTAILEVNLAVKPFTLIVPTVEIENLRQASIVYGPVQSAVGRAVSDAIEENLILTEALETYAIVAKVAVHPEALNRRALYRNTYEATKEALEQAWEQRRES